MFQKCLAALLGDDELSSQTRRLFSLLFLALASGLALMEYTRPVGSLTWWQWGLKRAVAAETVLMEPIPIPNPWSWVLEWWWPEDHKAEAVTFRPGVNEALVALALIAPLYLRGILKWRATIYSIVSLVLISFVVAMLVAIAMGNGRGQTSYVLAALVTAVGLSWLGMRSIAGLAWLFVLGAGVYSLHTSSITMGVAGFAFVISSFLGLVLHSDLNPGELWHGMMLEYSPTMRRALEASQGDVRVLGQNVGKLAETASRLALPGD